LVSRLKRDPELLSEYNHIIQDQLQSGSVERVPLNELDTTGAHYLPHHGVVRSEKETTKLRVVFDRSAKENESKQYINDHLETGPNFIPSLFDTLVRETEKAASVIEDDRTYVETVVGPQAVDESKTKILGLSWDTKEDELFFEFSEITSYAKQLPQTKRSVLILVL
jgi:hypothetical protein